MPPQGKNSSPPPPQGSHCSNFSHHRLALLSLELHVNGIVRFVLSVWLLPGDFSILWIVPGVPFIAEMYSILQGDRSLLLHLLADGHWGCLQIWAIMNNKAALHILV